MGAGLLDDYEIIVKPHPYLSVGGMLRSLLGSRMERVRIAGGKIQDELQAGTLVWASNSTTVALEASLLGLPVVVMWPHDNFDLCPLQDVPGLQRTGSLDDVRAALADPHVVSLPADYLELDENLPRWHALLDGKTE